MTSRFLICRNCWFLWSFIKNYERITESGLSLNLQMVYELHSVEFVYGTIGSHWLMVTEWWSLTIPEIEHFG